MSKDQALLPRHDLILGATIRCLERSVGSNIRLYIFEQIVVGSCLDGRQNIVVRRGIPTTLPAS